MFKTFSEVQQESTIIEIGTLIQRLCIGTDTDVPSTYTRRFSNQESRLLWRSHTFAIIVILDLKIQSMWIH